MASTRSKQQPDIGEQLQQTLKDSDPDKDKPKEEAPQEDAKVGEGPKVVAATVKEKRSLPTQKSKPSGELTDKVVTIYGPAKIGKSTLASEFAERMLFLDTEGGLEDLAVFRMSITDWNEFLEACALIAKEPEKWDGVVIDTADILALHCSQWTNAKLGIVHESDADYGKGWALARQEFTRALAKLAAMPDLGLIIISHSKEIEIKTRNSVYTKSVTTLTGQLKDVVLNLSDVILFCEFEDSDEGERRVMHSKPSRYYDSGERGKNPRLPATLPMSYEALRSAWYAKLSEKGS